MIWPTNSPRKKFGDVAGDAAGHWLSYALVSVMRRVSGSTDATSIFLKVAQCFISFKVSQKKPSSSSISSIPKGAWQ